MRSAAGQASARRGRAVAVVSLSQTGPAPNSRSCTFPPTRSFGLSFDEGLTAGLLALPNKQIAIYLSVELQTVKNRVSKILKKTDSRNRTECALKLAAGT